MFTFLLLQNYKLARVATWLTSRYSYGEPCWGTYSPWSDSARFSYFIPKQIHAAKPDQLHGRKAADGQRVCLRLGSIAETEVNHSLSNTR